MYGCDKNLLIDVLYCRLDDVADRVSVLHHAGYVLSSSGATVNVNNFADLPSRTGPWHLWRFQVISGAIVDASFKIDSGSVRATVNSDFETLLEIVRHLSMLCTTLQFRSTGVEDVDNTNWIDAFQLSQKTFRTFQTKYSNNGFNVPVDPVGFLSVTARHAEKFSMNKWIFSSSSSFCVSRLVSETLRQSLFLLLPDAVKAIK